jgi:hypothetical protein
MKKITVLMSLFLVMMSSCSESGSGGPRDPNNPRNPRLSAADSQQAQTDSQQH